MRSHDHSNDTIVVRVSINTAVASALMLDRSVVNVMRGISEKAAEESSADSGGKT